MNCKSILYTVTENVDVTANSIVPINRIIRKSGCGIRADGNEITLVQAGYYNVLVSATVQPAAIGDFTLSLYNNGTPIVGGAVTGKATAATDDTALNIVSVVRVACGCKNITVHASAAATVVNMSVSVEKV